MKTKQPRNTTRLLFAGIFIASALVIIAVLPRLSDWREARVQALISQSRQPAISRDLQEVYLQQAMTLGWGTTSAPKALANYYVSIGRYDKAWRVLQNWPQKPNFVQLGEYALKAQDYSAAQRLYAASIRQKPSAAGYSGLAAALFSLGDTKNGCANAAKATKLDLQSSAANNAAVACLILSPTNSNLQSASFPVLASSQAASSRGVGNLLLQAMAYKSAETKLLAANPKTPSDWLALAQLASARQDNMLALQRAKQGIAIDPTNPEIIQLLVLLYENIGDTNQANHYKDLSKALRFHSN